MNEKEQQENVKEIQNSVPDENGGFVFSSAIKIFDPNTSEILVQKRGDN